MIIHILFVYFHLFIVGLPILVMPQDDSLLLRGKVQEYRTKLLRALPGSLTCLSYSTVSSERQLVFVRLTSPGTSGFQVNRSMQLSHAGLLFEFWFDC